MAQVVVELSGDEQKLLKAYQKVRDAQNKMNASMRGVKQSARGLGDTAKTTGRQMDESFGNRAKQKLLSYAAGFGTIGAAARVASGIMQTLREDAASTLEIVDKLKGTSRPLNQVLSKSEKGGYTSRMIQLGRQTGVPFEQIQQMQFQRKSVGLSKGAIDDLTRAIGANLLEAAGGIEAAGKMPKLFETKFESPISSRQALNAALVASQKSMMSFEELATNLTTAVEGASQLKGTSPAEVLGVLSTFGDKFKPETAAQRINRFAATMARDERFRDKGLLDAYEALRAMPETERKKVIGESIQLSGAYAAFETIGIDAMRARVAAVQRAQETAGTPGSELNRAIRDATDRSTLLGATNYWERERNKALREQEAKALFEAPAVLEREAASIRKEAELRGQVDPYSRTIRKGIRGTLKYLEVPPDRSEQLEELWQKTTLGAQGINWLYQTLRNIERNTAGTKDAARESSNSLEMQQRMSGSQRAAIQEVPQ